MKIRMTFDIPPEANKWLANHQNGKITRETWRIKIDQLLTAFLQDISSDYEEKDNQ